MSKKKTVILIVGIVCALAVLLGIYLLFASGSVSVASGITVIIVSLASGLILPNPLSLLGLVAGICMLIFPPKAVGIVLMILGIGGMIANLAVWYKTKTE